MTNSGERVEKIHDTKSCSSKTCLIWPQPILNWTKVDVFEIRKQWLNSIFNDERSEKFSVKIFVNPHAHVAQKLQISADSATKLSHSKYDLDIKSTKNESWKGLNWYFPKAHQKPEGVSEVRFKKNVEKPPHP